MPHLDPRVDAYIARAADFAKPVLKELRARIHAACPEAEETLRWSAPHFLYHGKILCSFAAFKQHAAFGFWHRKELFGEGADDTAMGQFGRITSLADLPTKAATRALVKKAMALIDGDTPAQPARVRTRKPPPEVPADLAAALKKNRAARTSFEGFSNTSRREYCDWISEAKQEATRARRLATALEWLAEGKTRNWKYDKC